MTRNARITDENQHKCKMLGHSWEPQSQAKSGWTPGWGIGLILECDRCGCERRDIIDSNGNLSSRSYLYPPGYQYAKGSDRPSRAELRRMWIARERRRRSGQDPLPGTGDDG